MVCVDDLNSMLLLIILIILFHCDNLLHSIEIINESNYDFLRICFNLGALWKLCCQLQIPAI